MTDYSPGELLYSLTLPMQFSSEALEVSTFIHKNAKKQTARFVGHLEIGDNLKIPCKMYTKVSVPPLLLPKSRSQCYQIVGDCATKL